MRGLALVALCLAACEPTLGEGSHDLAHERLASMVDAHNQVLADFEDLRDGSESWLAEQIQTGFYRGAGPDEFAAWRALAAGPRDDADAADDADDPIAALRACADQPGNSVQVDANYVNAQLADLAQDEDLSRYIL